jgi:holo-[acyl-carrier protein] synthase
LGRPSFPDIGADPRRSVVSVGIDLTSVAEVRESVASFGDRYLRKIFTRSEIRDCYLAVDPAVHLAARFAAKEATIKALAVQDGQPAWTSMEVRRGSGSQPEMHLSGKAAALASALGIRSLLVSLTHEGDMAAAVVAATR